MLAPDPENDTDEESELGCAIEWLASVLLGFIQFSREIALRVTKIFTDTLIGGNTVAALSSNENMFPDLFRRCEVHKNTMVT